MIIKIIRNKCNGQFVASFSKKDLPKDFLDDYDKLGKVKAKIKFEGWS